MSESFQLLPMLLSLLISSSITILSIFLFTVVSHGNEQAGTWHHALPRGHSLDSLSVLDLGSSRLLKPRAALAPYLMGPDWIVDHHDFTCMLPIGTAAAVMQDFYEELARFAATTLTPASQSYRVCFGQINLDITAPPSTIVNWIVVQQFALELLRLTKRGYINTYQINYIHRPTGRMLTFSLYTGLLRAMAEGIP